MKKAVYILCACLLSVLMFKEFQKNMPGTENENERESTAVVSRAVSGDSISKKEMDRKVAYLTFDDGPSEITPQILDTLKKKQAKATFFLVGSEITDERADIVKRELKEGHSVGIHTYSHEKDELYCNEEFFFKDFNMCRERIKAVTGISPTLHRFPWGSNNGYVCPIVDDIIEKLKKENISSFDWNVSGEDSVGKTVAKSTIYRNVAKDLERFDEPIILLHDSNTMKNTAAVLGEIIDLISEKGYDFGTLDNREEYTFPVSWR